MKRKTNKIWLLTDEQFRTIVKNANSIKDIYIACSVPAVPGNFRIIKRRIQELGIDSSHLLTASQVTNMSKIMTCERFKNELLIENSLANRYHVKTYLRRFNLLAYECRTCKNSGTWNSIPLVLQLEHVNGICNDNRLENLCYLCPNCHSQTDTFAGKNVKR